MLCDSPEPLIVCTQLVAYCVCASAQGVAFVRWMRSSEEQKQNNWSLFGWFSGLATLGSFAGALAYGFRLGQLDFFYKFDKLDKALSSRSTPADLHEVNAVRGLSRRYTAAHFAFFPFELGFVVVTQLIVLSRMQNFIVQPSRQQLWEKARMCLLTIVVLLMLVGICGNFAAAFYFNQAAGLSMDAASAYASNSSKTEAAKLRSLANERHSFAGSTASIQRFAEVSALLLIISAFLTTGILGSRIILSALQKLFATQQRLVSIRGLAADNQRQVVASASDQGQKLHFKIFATTAFIFSSLLLRSLYTVLYAVAQSLQNNGDPCAISFCDPCKNMYSNIHGWLLFTPAFQYAVMLISSPISMLVALWGMTDVNALERMASSDVQNELVRIKTSRVNSRNFEKSRLLGRESVEVSIN